MMSPGATANLEQAGFGRPPTGCAPEWPAPAPGCKTRFLAIKGFAGGVPLNTETTAVKPRVGIE